MPLPVKEQELPGPIQCSLHPGLILPQPLIRELALAARTSRLPTLVIAVATVKMPTGRTYGKLRASNRTQAILLSQQLHLLSGRYHREYHRFHGAIRLWVDHRTTKYKL